MSLLENIRNITYYYIKKEYKIFLKEKKIKYMKKKQIINFSNDIFDNKSDKIKVYIKENLKKIMKNDMPKEEDLNELISDMMEDRDLVINRLVLEIELYQKKKKEKNKNK